MQSSLHAPNTNNILDAVQAVSFADLGPFRQFCQLFLILRPSSVDVERAISSLLYLLGPRRRTMKDKLVDFLLVLHGGTPWDLYDYGPVVKLFLGRYKNPLQTHRYEGKRKRRNGDSKYALPKTDDKELSEMATEMNKKRLEAESDNDSDSESEKIHQIHKIQPEATCSKCEEPLVERVAVSSRVCDEHPEKTNDSAIIEVYCTYYFCP
eukprot:gene1421-12552_t